MRLAVLLTFIGLAACEPIVTTAPAPESTLPREAVITRSSNDAVASYRRAAARIEPVAESLCRQQNPTFPRLACDFRFQLSSDPRLGQNAFQTIDKNGQPQVTFTLSLLRTLRNDDEVAFILGHETAHQINRHIMKSTAQQRLGAVLLGGLVAASGQATDLDVNRAANVGAMIGSRVYSKRFEIEADIVATYLSEVAGYDPVRGAAPFSRFETGSNGFLSTHPPSSDRLVTVQRTANSIAADRAAGRVPRLPRF